MSRPTQAPRETRRLTGARRKAALVLAVLGILSVLAGCARQSQPVTIGVAVDTVAELDDFARYTEADVGLYVWFQAWEGEPAFDAARASAVAARGVLPMVTWEPWSPDGGVDQPRYSLRSIVAGDHDEYLVAFADQVRGYGEPVAVRFLHELNAPHYPWSVGVNGNTAEQVQQAWRHVRAVFAERGADDVVWVWCLDASSPDGPAVGPLYPGDEHVDWVSVDGYNWGDTQPWSRWRTPEEVFGHVLEELETLTDRPVMITETGSAETGGDKGQWIHQLFRLAEERSVRAVVWFDYDKEVDWRLQSSAAALGAFRAEMAQEGRGAPPPGDLLPSSDGA